jgi:hypothetical protein
MASFIERAAASLLVLSTFTVAACSSSEEPREKDPVSETQQEISVSQIKIAGSLSYGETSLLTHYTRAPKRYTAYKFAGNAGEEIDVWVRSSNGDPVTWILDNDWNIIASNDDASTSSTDSHIKLTLPANPSATHYIVVRDYWLETMNFKVTLKGKSPDIAAGCNVDADCAKIEKGCCPLGNYIAVKSDKVSQYQASLNCSQPMACPAVIPQVNHAMAQCNLGTHKCELVKPKDIQCGGFTLNPHSCPPNYQCKLPAGIADAPGKCVQFCGGFAAFQCSDPSEVCVDNPDDSCDPNNGGADCGGICVPPTPPPPPPQSCQQTGCAAGQYCSFCWGSFACIPNGAMC